MTPQSLRQWLIAFISPTVPISTAVFLLFIRGHRYTYNKMDVINFYNFEQ